MSGADSLDLEYLFVGSDPMAADIGNKWLEWNGARSSVLSRWNESSQFVYATSTRETVNDNVGGFEGDNDDQEGWSHSTHVPKITQIADNLSANYMTTVMPHDDFFQYIGEDQDAALKDVRNKVEAYLTSKHRNSGFRATFQRLIDDFILYGNCFSTVHFVNETLEVQTGSEKITKGYVGPKVGRISPFDIVFNPLATDFRSTPKIVRSLKTIGELMRDVEEKPQLGYSKDIIEKWKESRSNIAQINHEDFNKHCQLSFDGFGTPSQYFGSGHVEILEFYGDLYDIATQTFYKNHVITVIDKKFLIRAEPLNTWDGHPLIFHAGWRTRPDNIWAMGPLDNLIGMQYLINHLENARADAFDQMLAPTRVTVGDVERVNIEPGRPGGEFRIPTGEGSVTNLLPDTTVLTADIQIERKMAQMEEFAGAPKEEMGFRTPGEKTLGEVDMLHRAASKVFQNKTAQLEGFMSQILNAELQVAKLYPDINDLIAVLGEDGVTDFIEITREDIQSNGKLIPVGARYNDRKRQLVQNFQLLQQVLSQDEMALQHFSSVKLAKLFEELMDMDVAGVVHPYVRVGERAQLSKLEQAAQTQVEAEDQVPLESQGGPTENTGAAAPNVPV